MNEDNSRQYYDDEIDLRQLFKSLKARSRLIFGFTGIVTLLAIGYVLSLPTPPLQYKVEASFLKPSESSVFQINQYSALTRAINKANTADTAESVFKSFLTNVNSQVLQKQVFIDGGYIDKLQKEGAVLKDVDDYITEFTKLISITKDSDEAGVELPHILSTVSFYSDVVSEFLNEVVTAADNKTITSIINLAQLKIANRLNEITSERQLLLTKTKADRLSQIKRIKEEDAQKLREIKDRIESARIQAKTERMNQIVILTNAAQLAATLGITKNNLNQFGEGSTQTNFNIAIQSGTNIPDWYLYGETALLEMITLLQNRVNDDPYIPELAVLHNQINKINNNNLLKTLEQRLDDSPFTTQIIKLDVEAIDLKSINLNPDTTSINAIQLYQPATSQIIPTKNNNLFIIALAFIGSFILIILLIFLMNAFKEEDITSIQKGK